MRDRLFNLAQQEQREFNLVLTAYATERLLFRIGQSDCAEQFVLKGARLFALWSGQQHRPTRDLDLLGFGDPAPASLRHVFHMLCRIACEDGLTFDENSVSVEDIRAEQEYGGQRVKLIARLDKARIPLQVDIGFGDAVTPPAELLDYTSLLKDMPAPRVRAYPRETVIAEKLHAMVVLDTMNTRMKDFYDLWTLGRQFAFDGPTLQAAIHATFARRKTPVPAELPVCLLPPFAEDEKRQQLWKAFLNRSGIQNPDCAEFPSVIEYLRAFTGPALVAVGNEGIAPPTVWTPDCGWQ